MHFGFILSRFFRVLKISNIKRLKQNSKQKSCLSQIKYFSLQLV